MQSKEAQVSDIGLQAAQAKMRAHGQSEESVRVFSHYYELLEHGESTEIPEDSIVPYTEPPSSSEIEVTKEQEVDALARTAVIKLNGGLGTSMGLAKAKTLLPVLDGKNFLDLTVDQVLFARAKFDVALPLLFMNSFRTEADTVEYLSRYSQLAVPGIPLSFVQSQEPRLVAETLEPLELAGDPEGEWCPPGHGDLYPSLVSSGALDALLERGFHFAQVSNGDNLGATPDPKLAAWFAGSGAPFAMEVCRRTANDRKGGHLALLKDTGNLLLREVAQTPDRDLDSFQDISRHPFFNTNTIWINLDRLKKLMTERGAVLGLPMIRNLKQAGEKPNDVSVVQIETAMGSAISVFEGATAIEVPRSRFLPVKTTNELLLLRSDLYDLTKSGALQLKTEQTPTVQLAPEFYGSIDQFDLRIPAAPSLVNATSLVVEGDWRFLPGASVTGEVFLGPDGGTFTGV